MLTSEAVQPRERVYTKAEWLANGQTFPDGWESVHYFGDSAEWLLREKAQAQVQPFTVLQLGCGRKKTLEALGMRLAMNGQPIDPERVRLINLDRLADVEPDVLCELSTDRIDLPDNSVDAVLAMHVLEHIGRQGEIEGWFHFWAELYRVMKPGGFVSFECPYFSSTWAWADPTHTRAISEMTFLYLNQDFYAVPGTAMPDYRPEFDFVQAEPLQIIPDHTNANVREREAVSFIRGRLVARKPLNRYWERG